MRCPKDGGIIAERRGRFRPFYGCVNYPACDFSLSVRPIPETCPQCGNPYLLFRERKSEKVFACDKAGCGFEKPAGELPPIVEFTPEAPPEAPEVAAAVVTKKAARPRAKKAAPKTKKAAKARSAGRAPRPRLRVILASYGRHPERSEGSQTRHETRLV